MSPFNICSIYFINISPKLRTKVGSDFCKDFSFLNYLELEKLLHLGSFDIFTDESWSESGPAWNHITHNSPTYTGSAGLLLICQVDNWMDLSVITIHIYNGTALYTISAYSIKLLSIGTTLYFLSVTNNTVTIYSDCQAVVSKLTKLQKSITALHFTTADSTLLTTALHYLKHRGQLQ